MKNMLDNILVHEKYFLFIKTTKSIKALNQEDMVVAIGTIINPILLKK